MTVECGTAELRLRAYLYAFLHLRRSRLACSFWVAAGLLLLGADWLLYYKSGVDGAFLHRLAPCICDFTKSTLPAQIFLF